MNRIDRLTAILIHLQSKNVVTANEIAERFGISIRTVYRDIRALEDAGVPIGARTGEGYSIVDGYHLPPVMFTREEAGSLIFGGKLTERYADESISRQFESALYKIKSVLEETDKAYLDYLHSNIEVLKFNTQRATFHNREILSDLHLHVGQKKMVEIVYRSAYKDETTIRLIEPLGLCFWGSNWHLIAYCTLRSDYRDFRISRIKQVTETGMIFDAGRHETLQSLMEKMSIPEELDKVVLRMDPDMARAIKEHKVFYGFVDEETKGTSIEMTFMTPSYTSFARWLITFLDQVEVVFPGELKELMKQQSEKLFHHYHNV